MSSTLNKFVSEIATWKKNNVFSGIDVATAAASKNAYTNALGLSKIGQDLKNSIANRDILSAVMGLGTISKSVQNSIGRRDTLSAVMGIGHVRESLVHKSTFASYAGLSNYDKKNLAGLTAVIGYSSTFKQYPSKYLVENIAQSVRLQTVMDAQLRFSSQYLGMAKLSSSIASYQQLNSLHKFYNAFTAGIAVKSAAIESEEELLLIEGITSQVTEFATNVSERGYVTQGDIGRFERILKYIGSVPKSDWQWLINLIVPSLLALWAIEIARHPESYGANVILAQSQNGDAATSNDFLKLEDTLSEYYNSSKPAGFEKKLIANVNLKAEPNKNAYTIKIVKKGTVVLSMDSKDDWVYISYIDSETNLPATGWISSRYFTKGIFTSKFRGGRRNATSSR